MNIQNIYEKSTASAFFVASSVMMSNLFLEDLKKFWKLCNSSGIVQEVFVAMFWDLFQICYLCIEIVIRDTDGHRVERSPRQLNPRFLK